MGMGGELWPKKKMLARSELAVCCFSFPFSLHPSLSSQIFQGLMVGEGERKPFKFLVDLFVLLSKLPHFSLRFGTVEMRLGLRNLILPNLC